MKVYSIVYCFCDKNGVIEQSENGDLIFSSVVKANNKEEAIIKFKEKENFLQEPDILQIKEVCLCR